MDPHCWHWVEKRRLKVIIRLTPVKLLIDYLFENNGFFALLTVPPLQLKDPYASQRQRNSTHC